MERTTTTQVIDRVVAILEVIAAAGSRGCRLKDIIETLGLKRATAYRLVDGLRSHGLIMLAEDGHSYQIGTRFLSLGGTASTLSTLRDLARPSLLRLASNFGDTFFLFVHDGYENVCIDYREGNYLAMSYARGIGGRVPLGIGQGSIAVLAFLPESERAEILAHNHHILVELYGMDMDKLHKEIGATRERGHTFGIGSSRLSEYGGIGFPIFNANRRIVGALSCSVLIGRFIGDKRDRMVRAMRSEVDVIERQVNPLDPVLVSPLRG